MATTQRHEKTTHGNDAEPDFKSPVGSVQTLDAPQNQMLQRKLQARHLSMIAIGGGIGTGLILGSGTALVQGGPASTLIGYCVIGFVCWTVMGALGEMSTFAPHPRGIAGHAARFVDPAFGFAAGWDYMLKYLIVIANNLNATALVISYWNSDISPGVWIAVFTVAVALCNFLGVRVFGEVEYFMSMVKVITLTGLIIMGICIDLGANPKHDRIGFRNWTNGQAFQPYIEKNNLALGRFLGMWSVMINALFSFIGTELVSVTAGEAANPRKTIPLAIKTTFWRIAIFYVGGVFVAGLLVPATSPELLNSSKTKASAAASPFVVAVQMAGIKVLPSIINAALLVFTVSAANSDAYISSRTLYALAQQNQAPAIFNRTNKKGVPIWTLVVTLPFCALAFLNLGAGGAVQVFNYLTSMVSMFGGIIWAVILFTHIRFMKACHVQGISRSSLPYRSLFQPYATYFGLFWTCLVLIFKGFDSFVPKFNPKTFTTNYLGFPIFAALYFGWKWWHKTRVWSPEEVDLVTGLSQFIEEEEREQVKNGEHTFWKKLKEWA